MNKTCLLIIFLNFLFLVVLGNPGDSIVVKKKYFTRQSNSIVTLDGLPSEEAWNLVEWAGDFIQWQPD